MTNQAEKLVNDSNLDAAQLSLLLYLETCAVDCGGRVDTRKMNPEEVGQAKEWAKEGFIGFGRIMAKDIVGPCGCWVELSDEAFRIVHAAREARAKRTFAKRTWRKTSEKGK